MGKPSKFSKLSGPQKTLYASLDAASPTLASDSVVFLQGGTAKKVTFSDMMADVDGTVTNTGLKSASGVLSVDIADMTGKTTPVAADSVMINDSENSDVLKGATLTNLAKPLADVMAGTAATTGLSDTSGVLTVAAKIAHFVADEKSSLFIETGEFDFSTSASAVDTKVIDAMAAKGQLLCALVSVSQVANGTTSAVISISSAASAGTKMTGDLTITLADTVYQNKVNNCMVMWPVTGANSIVASGGDVYFYAAASSGRTTGKLDYVLVFRKTA